MKSKTNQYIETEVPDVDEYGNKQFNPDGTEKTKNIGVPVEEIRFRKGYVFDVSQTDGKEIPSLVNELQGDIDREKMNAIFSGVKKAVGIPIEKVREQLNTDGVSFTAKENRKTTTFTVSTEDIDAYKNAVTKVKTEEKENQKIESLSAEHHIENTPEENIVDTKNFKVSNHAVDIIANQLKNDGIPFSAEKREIFTLFTISGQDESRFRESVERALPTIRRPSPDKTDHSEIPLYQESYNYVKNNNELTQFYNSLNAVKACDKFISENIEQELMNRNDKAFADEIENRFGLEKALTTSARMESVQKLPKNS